MTTANDDGVEIDLGRLFGGPDPEPPTGKRQRKVVNFPKDKTHFYRGDHVELASRVRAFYRLSSSSELLHTEGKFYIYREKSGKWETLSDNAIARTVHDFAGRPCGDLDRPRSLKIRMGDVNGALGVLRADLEAETFFQDAPPGVLFENGFVTVSEQGIRLEAHAPGNRARFGYEFPYVPAASPERLLAFLSSVYAQDADGLDRIRFDQEFFGAALLGLATRYHRVSVKTDARGGSGKSTLAAIMRAMMPPGSTVSTAPHSWGQAGNPGSYARAELVGKLLNLVTELPATDLDNLEAFKAIVAGDPIGAREPAGKPFTLFPRAAHYFSSNGLPNSKDLTQAFWDRVVVMPMTGHFRSGGDPRMADRVIQDRPLIVPWLIQGAANLVARGAYVLPPSHAAAVEEWKVNSDQVLQFLQHECCGAQIDARWTGSATIYNRYVRWSASEGVGKLSHRKFSQRIETAGYIKRRTAVGYEYNLTFLNGSPV